MSKNKNYSSEESVFSMLIGLMNKTEDKELKNELKKSAFIIREIVARKEGYAKNLEEKISAFENVWQRNLENYSCGEVLFIAKRKVGYDKKENPVFVNEPLVGFVAQNLPPMSKIILYSNMQPTGLRPEDIVAWKHLESIPSWVNEGG